MSTDVSTSHLGTEEPVVPVATPEPSPPTQRQAVPMLSASQTVVEPARPRRAADEPVRIAEPTSAGPAAREVPRSGAAGAGRASANDERSAERLSTVDRALFPNIDDTTPEPVLVDKTTGESWALFDKPAEPVVKPKRPARQHRARTFVVMTVVLAMVVGVGYVVATSFNIFDRGSGVSDYTGEGEGSVDVTVRRGDSGVAIAKTLYDAEVIAREKAFVDACRASSDCQSIQPGTYSLRKHMSAAAALAALLNQDNRKSGRLTIKEGKTTTEIVEQVNLSTGIPMDDLNAAIADPTSIGLPAEANGIVEGWLYPTTYDVDPGATAVEVLTMMVDKTRAVLTAKQVPQADWQRVLITASIVEREGGVNTETGEDYRPKVARAIQNRQAIGKPLEVDATTSYGAGHPGQAPTPEENADAGNPYNTYKHTGLPPGPIASPGEVAIDAVLNPADGDWIYWVTINYVTKDTRFAATYPEHQQNVELLREWYNQQTAPPEP